MGHYAKRLHRKMASQTQNLPTEEPKRRPGELLPGGSKDIPTLIKEGHDPIHAVYVFMQNLTAYFAEVVAEWPEMTTWARAVEEAEDEYMPSGPPMSPLTGSFFWMWALYDLRIGKSTDTLAYCQIAMTTPYVLLGASKTDWGAFLKRTMLQCDGPNDRTRLHNLLKYGLEPNYWNEFVFKAYHHHQHDAIFLTGIPDIGATLSHA